MTSGARGNLLILDDADDDIAADDAIKTLLDKLLRSEKSRLIAHGLPPKRKNRMGNLVYYMDTLTDGEQALLVKILNRRRQGGQELHVGVLPFVERDFAVSCVYDELDSNRWYQRSRSYRPGKGHNVNININVDAASFRTSMDKTNAKIKETIQKTMRASIAGALTGRARRH